MVNYTAELINFYSCNDAISLLLDEAENSEEKESTEKEEFKESEKIVQQSDEGIIALADLLVKRFPEFYSANSSVYLEQVTPPPKSS